MPKAYLAVEDVALKLNCTSKRIFFLACQAHNVPQADQAGKALYDIYCETNDVPDWLLDWLLLILVGRIFVPPLAKKRLKGGLE